MNKKIFIGFLKIVVLSLCLTGCSDYKDKLDLSVQNDRVNINSKNINNNLPDIVNSMDFISEELDISGDTGQLYILAFDDILNKEFKSNSSPRYIAINMQSLKGIGKEEYENIIKHLEGYNCKVYDLNFDEINNKIEDSKYGLSGIFVSCNKIKVISKERVTITVSKYRAPLGSEGHENTYILKDGIWEIESRGLYWQS